MGLLLDWPLNCLVVAKGQHPYPTQETLTKCAGTHANKQTLNARLDERQTSTPLEDSNVETNRTSLCELIIHIARLWRTSALQWESKDWFDDNRYISSNGCWSRNAASTRPSSPTQQPVPRRTLSATYAKEYKRSCGKRKILGRATRETRFSYPDRHNLKNCHAGLTEV